MRDILDKLDNVLLEKARGLLYRDKGDQFFQGSKDNPTAELVFDKVEYFPRQPGAYSSYDEMAQAGQDLYKQYGEITWSNRPTQASKAFAVLTFDGPQPGQKTHFGRFFNDIKADMSGLWKNNELPGGWQLNKAVSLKGAYYKLKPVDLFPPESTFETPGDCVESLAANPKNNPAVPKILPGMQQLVAGELPTFENVGDMVTAIRDDLGETIGPIALVQGMITSSGAEAARKDILGKNGSYAGSAINFPATKNNGLVDSYLMHPSGIEIGISSKGEKGASASAKNIADGVAVAQERGMTKLLDQYAPQVEVINEVARLSSLDFPLVYGERMGLITEAQAGIVRDLVKKGAKDLRQVSMDAEDRKTLQGIMGKYTPRPNPRYNVGYHIVASLARDVAADINKDPKFGEACLKFLNISPIIQLHLLGKQSKDAYTVTGFSSKYPPDFRGTVGLDATKVYSATGIIGRISFSYNGGGDQDTDVMQTVATPTPGEVDQGIERLEKQRSRVTARAKGAEEPEPDEKALGRKRRKK